MIFYKKGILVSVELSFAWLRNVHLMTLLGSTKRVHHFDKVIVTSLDRVLEIFDSWLTTCENKHRIHDEPYQRGWIKAQGLHWNETGYVIWWNWKW